ncbi:hypothetical protein D3C85_1403650 [compost metagenome]
MSTLCTGSGSDSTSVESMPARQIWSDPQVARSGSRYWRACSSTGSSGSILRRRSTMRALYSFTASRTRSSFDGK